MEVPFASMFILKLFLLSLLTVTTNAAKSPTPKKLISDICSKTKRPQKCFQIMVIDPATRSAYTLHDLGLGTLEHAKMEARASANVFNSILLKKRDLPQKEKDIYKDCRENYVTAMTKLGEAKTAWNEKKYAIARKDIEFASKVPTSCEKALVGTTPAVTMRVKQANVMADMIFDIAFVIGKEIEGNGNKTEDASI